MPLETELVVPRESHSCLAASRPEATFRAKAIIAPLMALMIGPNRALTMSVTSFTNQSMNFRSASASGFRTWFLKSFQSPVVRPLTTLMNACASHFPTFVKKAPTATAAFHTYAANPATVFQNSCHRLCGGGGGDTVQFPPLTTDVFAASFETSHANPRV